MLFCRHLYTYVYGYISAQNRHTFYDFLSDMNFYHVASCRRSREAYFRPFQYRLVGHDALDMIGIVID